MGLASNFCRPPGWTRAAAWGLTLCLGCSPIPSTHQVLYRDFVSYPAVTDHQQSVKTYRAWALSEWGQYSAAAERHATGAFKRGFLAGFVDAVYAGGDGEAPIVPPKPYWRVLFRSHAGDTLIQDWTNGFREGARVALDNGYRQRALVPVTRPQVLDPDSAWNHSANGSPSTGQQSNSSVPPQEFGGQHPAFLQQPGRAQQLPPSEEPLPAPSSFEWGELSLESVPATPSP